MMTKKDVLIQEAARYIARSQPRGLSEAKGPAKRIPSGHLPLRVVTNEGDEVHEIMDQAHPKGKQIWSGPGKHTDIEMKIARYIHGKAKLPGISHADVAQYLSNFTGHFRVPDEEEFPHFPPTHRHPTMAAFLRKKGDEEAETLKQEYKDGVFSTEPDEPAEAEPPKPRYDSQNEIHSSGPFVVHKDSNNNDPSKYKVHVFNKKNQTHVGSITVLRREHPTRTKDDVAYQLKYNLKPIIDNSFNTGKNHREVFDSISTAVHNHIMTELHPKK